MSGILPLYGDDYGEVYYNCEDSEDGDECFGKCFVCRQVCKTFPIRDVIQRIFDPGQHFCMASSIEEALSLLSTRSGFLEYLNSRECLSMLLDKMLFEESVMNYMLVHEGRLLCSAEVRRQVKSRGFFPCVSSADFESGTSGTT